MGLEDSVLVYGASGHAKVILDIIEKVGSYRVLGMIDDKESLAGTDFCGYPVFGSDDYLSIRSVRSGNIFFAVGDNETRCRISRKNSLASFAVINAIHPSAQLSNLVEVGRGVAIMANAVVNSSSIIGDNVIINTAATVDHDCVIDEGVHVAPNATLCGGVKVGEMTFLGAGVTVIPNIQIGRNVYIGAGTTVYSNVADGQFLVGPRYE